MRQCLNSIFVHRGGIDCQRHQRQSFSNRAGFVATRLNVFEAIKHAEMPIRESAGERSRKMGQGLTAAKMLECIWLRPETAAQFEFLEWTGADHLRHTKFVGLRGDKEPRKVIREA